MKIDRGPSPWSGPRRFAIYVLAALVIGFGGHAAPVEAQDPLPERFRQLACSQAEQMLGESDAAADYLEGLTAMTRCPELGAALLVRRWRNLPPDIERGRDALVHSTMAVRDERIFATMLDLVADRQAPRQVRLAALTVAVNYADTTLSPRFRPEEEMREPFPGRGNVPFTQFSAGGGRLGAYGPRRAGPRPVEGNPLERVKAVLEVIENRPEEDEYVRGAVRALFSWYKPFWRRPYNCRVGGPGSCGGSGFPLEPDLPG